MKAILAACVLLAGCALIAPPPPKPAAARPRLPEMLSTLSIGKSTKSDVLAALGNGTVVDFPSGYEIWVYREESPAHGKELVLLFDSSGTLTKTRLR